MLSVVLIVKMLLKLYENKYQNTNQKGFRDEKVIKKKGDKLFVKWKDYDNFFNSCIYKKGIII